MNKKSFNQQYLEEECYWGLSPNKEVIKIPNYKQSGTVLDLGCGEGKNGLYLAKKRFDVTGIDISPNGIEKFLKLADQMRLKVNGVVENIIDFEFKQKYDCIICMSTLHFLEKNEIGIIINEMKENTNPNGLNVINVFTTDNPNKNFNYLFQKNELKGFYNDWRILQYEECLTTLEKHGKNGQLHRHGIASIIAEKKK